MFNLIIESSDHKIVENNIPLNEHGLSKRLQKLSSHVIDVIEGLNKSNFEKESKIRSLEEERSVIYRI